MPEKLEIVIAAKDQASPVLKGLAGNMRGELKSLEGAHASLASSATGMATTTQGAFKSMSGYVQEHEAQLQAAGAAMVAFGVAVTAVAAKSVQAYGESEVATAKLTAAIKGTRQSIDQSRLEKLAADLQKLTIYEDDATIGMMAMLTTFDLTQDQIEQLAPRIQNISAIMGTDLQSAAIAVGKAISTANYGALQRFGIIIDEDIKKSGNFADILKAIDRNTGPAAEELAKTANGALLQFKNAVGDAGESIGKALVPALRATVSVLQPVAELINFVADTPLGTVFITAGTAVGVLMVPLGGLLMALPRLLVSWEALTGAQLRNAAAARLAATANAGALAVAGGGAAAAGVAAVGGAAARSAAPAIATGAAAAGGAAAGRFGIAGAARLAGGAAARYALPAYIAYEGAKYAWGMKGDEKDMTFGETITTALHARSIEAEAAKPGVPGKGRRRTASLLLGPRGDEDPLSAADRKLNPMEQGLADQGYTSDERGGWIAPVGARTGSTRKAPPISNNASSQGVRIDMKPTAQGNELHIIVPLAAEPDPGTYDDFTTDYLDDMAYGAGL